MTDLERSHLELRGALIIAGRRIRQLQFGRRNDDPVLRKLRSVFREAEEIAKAHARGGGFGALRNRILRGRTRERTVAEQPQNAFNLSR